MKTKTHPWPGGKTYRQTFADMAAIAANGTYVHQPFSGPGHGPASGAPQNRALATAPGFSRETCCALIPAGKYPRVCGLSPAPYLDLERGGMVCAAHRPDRGEA